MEYHDFRIEISEISRSRLRIVHLDDHVEAASAETDFPAELLRHSTKLKARKLPEVTSAELGGNLGSILMAGDVRNKFHRVRERQVNDSLGIRVLLHLQGDDLELLPWETAHLPDLAGRPVLLDGDSTLSLIRTGPPTRQRFRSARAARFKALVVDLGDIETTEQGQLAHPDTTAEVTQNLPKGSYHCMSRMVTWEDVLNELDRAYSGDGKQYTILHLRGHGSSEPPGLWFGSANGPQRVDADRIVSELGLGAEAHRCDRMPRWQCSGMERTRRRGDDRRPPSSNLDAGKLRGAGGHALLLSALGVPFQGVLPR